MDSDLKNQTQLLTLAILNFMKICENNKENEGVYNLLKQSNIQLTLSLETYLSATALLKSSDFNTEYENIKNNELSENESSSDDSSSDDSDDDKMKKSKKRIMSNYFNDNQQIKHVLDGDEWIGIFNKKKEKIMYRGKEYTLNSFVKEHYEICRGKYTPVNAWKACKYEKGNKWLSTSNL